jgi:hypothetical protein
MAVRLYKKEKIFYTDKKENTIFIIYEEGLPNI